MAVYRCVGVLSLQCVHTIQKRKLVGQPGNDKVTTEMLSLELGKTKMELEQEKKKCANAKEKLSLAMKEGKALVQLHDALRQSL